MKTYRHEQKYLMNMAQYQELVPVIHAMLDQDKHVKDTGEYMIRSLYFDDMYQSAYQEKLSGVYSRKKYRIRIYNCQSQVIHLECKYKQGPYICKESLFDTSGVGTDSERGLPLSVKKEFAHGAGILYGLPFQIVTSQSHCRL